MLETLIQAGYNESTIFNYRGVIRSFKALCKEKEAFEYTPELGQPYSNDVISKKTGEFSKQRYFSQGRFARLLASYYCTGFFDLSVIKHGRKEPENENLNKLYHEYGSYLRKSTPTKIRCSGEPYILLTDLKYYAEEFQPFRIISREFHVFGIVFSSA